MLRQAINKVKIEGILAEVDIKPTSFSKNGMMVDAIGGKIVVKVVQSIPAKTPEREFMIPVHMFASKMTNSGRPNPAYESIMKVANEFVSIAAAGSEEGADRIRITNANIRMNEYYAPDGRLISFPRINASFVQKVSQNAEFRPQTSFETEFMVLSKNEEVDRNGEETGRYHIQAALPQYGGKVDVVDFYGETPGVVDAISTYWEIGNTVKAVGKLDFSSKTEITYEEVDFGEPIEKIRTVSKSDLVITGGSQEPLEDEAAFAQADIRQALAERKARLESQKERDMSNTRQRQAPPQNTGNGFADLGF